MGRIWSFVLLALIATLLVGGRASAQEYGALHDVSVDGAIATVTGSTIGEASVHVYLDGVFSVGASADPDFAVTLPATPGNHEVCAYAITPGATGNPTLGCLEFTADPAEPGPWLAISSDFHVSTEGGRWPDNDNRLEAFVAELQSYEVPPEMLVVAGDMVDNVAFEDGELEAGDLERWQSDVARYLAIVKSLERIDRVHALGPGHDFGSAVPIDVAEEVFGHRRGYRDWQGSRLIWLESTPGASVLSWLDQVLENAPGEAVLVFHVPVRTSATERLDADRTLPSSDPLYDVLERHAESIATIVNGHIHHASASELLGIPIHLCPLIDMGSYCRLVATDAGVVVERAALRPWQ